MRAIIQNEKKKSHVSVARRHTLNANFKVSHFLSRCIRRSKKKNQNNTNRVHQAVQKRKHQNLTIIIIHFLPSPKREAQEISQGFLPEENSTSTFPPKSPVGDSFPFGCHRAIPALTWLSEIEIKILEATARGASVGVVSPVLSSLERIYQIFMKFAVVIVFGFFAAIFSSCSSWVGGC